MDGLRAPEIAEELGLALSTIKTHVHSILHRAHLATMREVVEEILHSRS